MKIISNPKCIYFILLFSLLTSIVYSQAKEKNIKLIANYTNSNVQLRWGITDIYTWEYLKNNGFSIKRTTISDNGVPLTLQQQYESEEIIQSELLPITDQEFSNKYSPSNEEATAVRKSIYSTEDDIEINLTDPKLSDALNYKQQLEAKLFVIMLACERDYELAKDAALAYEDNTVEENKTYRYVVSPVDVNPAFGIEVGIVEISTSGNGSSPAAIENLEAISLPKGIELRWNVNTANKYFAFEIQRSEDGINFTSITEKPFVFMSEDNLNLGYITFADSVSTDSNFYYKVAAYTPFGTLTEFSDIVSAQATEPRTDSFPLQILEPTYGNATAIINWNMPVETEQKIQGFNIYAAQFSQDKFVKVNTALILKSNRSYTVNNPKSTSYYKVEALDNNDFSYETYPMLVQPPDSIPPAPPLGLTAKYFNESKVVLTWNANHEEDFSGYRVYYSNQIEGPFTQITASPIPDTTYIHYSDPTVVADSIFFAIKSTDHRQNYSEFSDIFGLKRPDIVPPSKPSLHRAMATRNGIELSWKYSTTESVTKHYLERRPVNTPNWVTVIDIPNASKGEYMPSQNQEYNFLDETELENREYEYRLVAVESPSSKSASDFTSVTPLKDAVTGTTVSDFSIKVNTETIPANVNVTTQINNLKKARGVVTNRFTPNTPEKHNVELSFTYELNENLKEFQILRSITSGPTEIYRTVTVEEAMGLDPNTQQANITGSLGPKKFIIKDEDLLKGRRYTYQIVANHKDHTSTPRSNSLSVKI